MTSLNNAIDEVLAVQKGTEEPLAVIIAGHNGSGKSTMWRDSLADRFQTPLINADRMMLSVLPEAKSTGALETWARTLRDTDESWMRVAREAVQSFAVHAMQSKVPFAYETVFSYWQPQPDGTTNSKLELIQQL